MVDKVASSQAKVTQQQTQPKDKSRFPWIQALAGAITGGAVAEVARRYAPVKDEMIKSHENPSEGRQALETKINTAADDVGQKIAREIALQEALVECAEGNLNLDDVTSEFKNNEELRELFPDKKSQETAIAEFTKMKTELDKLPEGDRAKAVEQYRKTVQIAAKIDEVSGDFRYFGNDLKSTRQEISRAFDEKINAAGEGTEEKALLQEAKTTASNMYEEMVKAGKQVVKENRSAAKWVGLGTAAGAVVVGTAAKLLGGGNKETQKD